MRQTHFVLRTHLYLKLCVLAMLGACGGGTEPPPPKLAAYYTVVAIDGQPLPAPVMLGRYDPQPMSGSLASVAVTLDPLYMKLDMSFLTSASNHLVTVLWPDGPVIIGRDSLEFHARFSTTPVLVGRFTDTSLVLAPVGGVRASEPVDILEAHAWKLRPLR